MNYSDSIDLIERLTSLDSQNKESEEAVFWDSDPKKGVLYGTNQDGEKVIDFRVPITFPTLPTKEDEQKTLCFSDYSDKIAFLPKPYLLILIQSGYASLGYFEDGELIYHKAITAYMVRKKQGKSQIKHLNSKGKSRLGSRIRLQNTILFFEQINSKLKEWHKKSAIFDKVECIGQSGSPDLWHLFYTSKETAPFQKDDSRLRKVPITVHAPNFEELQRVNSWANRGKITTYKDNLPFLNNLGDVIEW
ncbi:hypothetical protein Fleli_2844 [Bernardetia litoralis DSM 6794]|uniref:VLRF1 domain-containing protein n=1 Tax=Bernardetia litoralis (strain ATCC 23117 / DSM 6794 / NBRC 15988 / NCIMB 1366 / Fx l1 / Sio-4) TaxID=880071 RepID=I4AML2_BERLS|nr:hypothetical protein [Bernardetia litoralis]AFM05197.1 hypothetical protein Fleli_2844 [Bernardetia litoralis DSM 6794]